MVKENLPKREFKNCIKALKNEGITINESVFFHFSIFGNVFEKDNELIVEIWLNLIDKNFYPVKHNKSLYISIEIKSQIMNQYPFGSIYDFEGFLVNTPKHSIDQLIEFNLNSNELSYKDTGFYKKIDTDLFALTPKNSDVLRGYPYYYSYNRNKDLKIIIPINVVITSFFFNEKVGSNAIHSILRVSDILEKVKSHIIKKDNNIEGEIFRPSGLFDTNKEFFQIFKHLFTEKGTGRKSLERLIGYHLHSTLKRRKGFLNTKIPFDDISLNLLGQFIDNEKKVFYCYSLSYLERENHYKTKTITIKKEKTKYKKPNEAKPIKLKANNYDKINLSEVLDEPSYNPSSPGVDIIHPISETPTSYSPLMKTKDLEGKETDVYIIVGSNKGTHFDSITDNIDNQDPDSTSVKASHTPEDKKKLEWNKVAIQSLKEICLEKEIKGKFLYLDNGKNVKIDLNNSEKKNVISNINLINNIKFQCLLFEFEINNHFYYFMDRGGKKLSTMFKSELGISYSSNQIKEILTTAYSKKHNGNWSSSILKKDLYKTHKILLYKSILHTKYKSEEDAIKKLKERILDRINTNDKKLKVYNL